MDYHRSSTQKVIPIIGSPTLVIDMKVKQRDSVIWLKINL